MHLNSLQLFPCSYVKNELSAQHLSETPTSYISRTSNGTVNVPLCNLSGMV
ncbi:Hypothetical predicted protein [Podarcis lilfordi]|uniref:Uncharacterized protein n=1 Tax=Podarcis lilfordi TaxID=74358 RepID=A0AA35KB07_9SAUR|nr:Hypothetical predicted protein [Podarcis lilfordi]